MSGVSKVNFGDSSVIDLTSDTVSPEHLEYGYTAHAANGDLIVGTLVPTRDTGWQSFSPKTGFSVQNPLYKRRIGNIVFITGSVRYTPTIEQSAYATLLDDIGEDYRPEITQNMLPLGGDTAGFLMYVTPAGEVLIRNRTGSAKTNQYIALGVCYAI